MEHFSEGSNCDKANGNKTGKPLYLVAPERDQVKANRSNSGGTWRVETLAEASGL